MPNTCFVPGCKSGYWNVVKEQKAAGIKVPTMFKAPNDPVQLKLWEIAIRRKDKQLTKNSKICSLHFQEDDIQRYFVTKLINGDINKIERGRVCLKPGAVPSIFPSYRVHIAKKFPKLKLNNNNTSVSGLPKNKNTYSVDIAPEFSIEGDIDVDPNQNVYFENSIENTKENEDVNVIDKNYSINIVKIDENGDHSVNTNNNETMHDNINEDHLLYKELHKNLILIEKPNDWWTINATSYYIVCARWTATHIVQRTVIIENSLLTKIYIREREIIIPDLSKITSVNDVSILLKKVESYNICAGVNRFKDCHVCLLASNTFTLGRRYRKWCTPCAQSVKREHRAESQINKVKTAEKDAKRRIQLKYEKRKNMRLKNKVHNLRRRLKIYEKLCPSIRKEVNRISKSFSSPILKKKYDFSDLDSDEQETVFNSNEVLNSDDEAFTSQKAFSSDDDLNSNDETFNFDDECTNPDVVAPNSSDVNEKRPLIYNISLEQ